MSQPKPRIDAHCHLFNIFFLTSEIGEILWDTLWGNYPHRPEALKAFGAPAGVSLGSIRAWLNDLLTQISQVAHSSFNSYEENFNLLTAAYKTSFKTDEPLILYPLMMDIHYMVAEPCTAPPKALVPKTLRKKGAGDPPIEDPRAAFDALFAEVKRP